MGLEKEIERAVKRTASLDAKSGKKPSEQEKIISMVKISQENGTFDFSNTTSLLLTQNGKKRLVKQYEDLYSAENILCQCIKQILDRSFKVKYPNRNKTVKELLGIIAATAQMSDFTIVKFDFKDYFNSVSSIYVFEKYLKHGLQDRHEIDLIKDFVDATKYAYAGLCTSNAIAEIIAKKFDEAVRQTFVTNGLIYYERYIDDTVLILNKYMEQVEIEEILKNILADIFHDKSIKCAVKCKTKFNNKKHKYITRREILSAGCSFDFLGYEFFLLPNNRKIILQYGITEAKREKYKRRIDKLILYYKDPKYPDCGDLELLRHRIAAFSSREVYLTKHFHSNVWKVKGFISNYGELRYLLDTNLISHETKNYLQNMIKDAFDRAKIPMPYFMGGDPLTSGYNLHRNMKANKTILLIDRIGYDYKSLVELCEQIGISTVDINGKRRGYGTLVRDYLIKVKVGY